MTLVWRVPVASLLLLIARAVLAPWFRLPGVEGGELLAVASTVLTAATVATIDSLARGTKRRRALLIFALMFGIESNNLVETIVFSLQIPRAEIVAIWSYMFAVDVVFAGLLVLVPRPPLPPHQRGPLPARLPVALGICVGLYIAAYFIAGTLVFPFVSHFYAGQPLPGFAPLALMQVVRGLLFSALVLMLVRGLQASRLQKTVLAAAALSIVGGVAPLIVPNPYMPADIRFAHLIEVAVSNLVFGAAAAWILQWERRPDVVPA